MPEYNEILIEWKMLDESELNSDKLIIDSSKYYENKFLYCVYCDSHIYGRDVLAYIGQTKNFDVRKNQHLKSYFTFASNVRFVIGLIEKEFIKEDFCLDIIESIEIANHKPYYNKEYIHDVSNKAKEAKYIIMNNGEHGSLKNCVTNYWWVVNKDNDEGKAIEQAEKLKG